MGAGTLSAFTSPFADVVESTVRTLIVNMASMLVFAAVLGLFSLSFFWQFRRARTRGMFSPLTENLLRLPGHTLRERRDALLDDLLFDCLGYSLAAGLILVLWHTGDSLPGRWIVIVAFAAGMLWVLWRAQGRFEELRRLSLGLECETYTGQELNYLMRDGAYVFHDIPYQYGNIDHVVVGHDRLLAVETKGVRKPRGKGGESSRNATVRFDGAKLHFPHYVTAEPLEQATRHARFLADAIRRGCGVSMPVVAVVSLPGWFVEHGAPHGADMIVINPKRARILRHHLGRRGAFAERDRVVNYLQAVAQSITPASRRTDPDAAKHYDFWLEPRYRERTLEDR